MNKIKYQSNMALHEHMLGGNRITLIEALMILVFKHSIVNNYHESGIFIKSQKIPMIQVIKRMKKYSTCQPPKNLPTKEILMTEYWVSK